MDVNPCKIGQEKLIEKLRLGTCTTGRGRRRGQLLQQAIATAMAELSEDWQQDGSRMFTST